MAFSAALLALALQASQSPEWRNLLHYKRRPWGTMVSEADDPRFFTSPEGKTDPLQELLASLENPDQKFQCTFPARYRYLKKTFDLKSEDFSCPELAAWKARFDARSVSLVFASAYLNNPASAFGHTFLRINSSKNSAKSREILNEAISFGANALDDLGLIYALSGLTGRYQGRFEQLPYYMKINEYHDLESRDIWEYELDLSDEEIERMIDHLWEMQRTHFDYYFLDENCSYHLLSLIEVAKPEWRLRNRFVYWVIPVDTVRVFREIPGAFRAVNFRPSHFKVVKNRFELLSPEERKIAEENVHTAPPSASANTLSALLELQKYQILKKDRAPSAEEEQLQREWLLKLADMSEKPAPVRIDATERPDLGQRTSKISIYSRGRSAVGTQVRAAYHDLYDNDFGYPKFQEITVAQVAAEFSLREKRFYLQEVVPLAVTSLSPIEPLNKTFSFNFTGDFRSPPAWDCSTCYAGRARGGLGAAYGFFSERMIAFSLLRANVEAARRFRNYVRVGPSLWNGVLFGSNLLKVGIEAEPSIFFLDKKSFTFEFHSSATFAFFLPSQHFDRLQIRVQFADLKELSLFLSCSL